MMMSDTVLRRDPQADADDEPTRAKRQRMRGWRSWRSCSVRPLDDPQFPAGLGLGRDPRHRDLAVVREGQSTLASGQTQRAAPGRSSRRASPSSSGCPSSSWLVQGAREAHDVLELYQKATTSGIPVPDWVSHLPFGSGAVQTWWQDNLSRRSSGGWRPDQTRQPRFRAADRSRRRHPGLASARDLLLCPDDAVLPAEGWQGAGARPAEGQSRSCSARGASAWLGRWSPRCTARSTVSCSWDSAKAS